MYQRENEFVHFHNTSENLLIDNFKIDFRATKTIRQRTYVPCLAESDPDGNRTRVTAVKGRCLNRLTTGPYIK